MQFHMETKHKYRASFAPLTLFFLVLIFLFSFPALLSSHTGPIKDEIILTGNHDYDLKPVLHYLEDPNGELTIHEISALDTGKDFEPLSSVHGNFGFTESTYWLRFQARNDTDLKDWVLVFDYPMVERVSLFFKDRNEAILEHKITDNTPYNQRDYRLRYPVFNLPRIESKPSTFHLKVQTRGTMRFPFHVMTPNRLMSRISFQNYGFGLYYGAALVLAIINLVLILVFRNRNYFFFMIFLICYVIFESIQNGHLFEILGVPPGDMKFPLYFLSSSLGMAVTMLFARGFLETWKRAPVMDRLLLVLAPLFLLSGVFGVILGPGMMLSVYTLTVLIWALTNLAAGILITAGGYRPARYYLTAWAFMIIGFIFFALRGRGQLPDNLLTLYGNQAGFFALMFFITLALNDRINLLKQERLEARDQALENMERVNRMKEEMIHAMERNDRLRDDFLYRIGNELEPPLHSLMAMTDSIRQGSYGTVPHAAHRNLDLMRASLERLSGLVTDIADYVRIRHNSIDLSPGWTDIPTLAGLAVQIMRPYAVERGLSLSFRSEEDVPSCMCDEKRIYQVIMNLLDNAITYTSDGYIEVEVSTIQGEEISLVEISVTDTGAGIDDDMLPRVFNLFEENEDSDSRVKGAGIGLSISRHLVELHSGSIHVESETGKGSTFRIHLPPEGGGRILQSPHREHGSREIELLPDASAAADTQETGQHSAKNVSVLVVDDDPLICRVLEGYLVREGYNAMIETNALLAMEKLEARKVFPDILLLDAFIPGLSSPEMIRNIRAIYNESRLPIIVLTLREQVELIQESFRAGASDYLMKPISRDDLSIRLRNTLLLRQIAQHRQRIHVIEQDLGMARKIQLSTLPSRPPELAGLEIGILYVPMEKVGGDFYNFHVVEEKNLGILITDVSGHGIAAALISSMIKVTFSTLKERARTPADFLTEMSRIMVEHLDEHFLTAGYAYIDIEERVIHLARAGHEPTIVYHRSTGDVKDYFPGGAMISPMVQKPFGELKIPLEPGDRVILYTDCVTEIMNNEGKMFGKRKFNEFIRSTADLKAEEVTSRLIVELWSWSGGKDVFDDDLTVLVVDIS